MSKTTVPLAIATLFALQSLAFTPAAAQEAMEKKSYNYSAWTPGIFSEAVTITNMGKGKFIFLAGVGAEDENGPRGKIRHAGDFAGRYRIVLTLSASWLVGASLGPLRGVVSHRRRWRRPMAAREDLCLQEVGALVVFYGLVGVGDGDGAVGFLARQRPAGRQRKAHRP